MKGKRGLLAVVMALAMVFAGVALSISDNAVDADTEKVVFVDPVSGDDTKDGLSEDKAKKTMQNALTVTGVTTLRLLNNVTLEKTLQIGVNVTIDLNDKKLSVTSDESARAAVNADGKTLVIKNGSLYVNMTGYVAGYESGTGVNAIRAGSLTFDDVVGELYINATSTGVPEDTSSEKKQNSHATWATNLTIQNNSIIDAYGANRGLYAHHITIDNSTVTSGGYEKGIRAEDSNVDSSIEIKGSSIVDAVLIPGGEVNIGENDRMGVKAENIVIEEGAKLTTEGVHIVQSGTISGVLDVKYNDQAGKYDVTEDGTKDVVYPGGFVAGKNGEGGYSSFSVITVTMIGPDAKIIIAEGSEINAKIQTKAEAEGEANGDATIRYVVAANGEITISVGSLKISGAMTSVGDGATISCSSDVVLSDFEVVSGVLILSGQVSTAGDVRVSSKATLQTGDNLTVGSKSNLSIYGKTTGKTKVDGNLTAYAGADVEGLTYDSGSSGTVDTSAASKEFIIGGGEYNSKSVEYGPNQIVRITGDLYLVKGSVMTIEGEIVIEDGATLYIQEESQLRISSFPAKMTVDGSIVIETMAKGTKGALQIDGGQAIINGTLETGYEYDEDDGFDGYTILNCGKMVINGSFELGTDDKYAVGVESASLNVEKGSVTSILGYFDGGAVNKVAGTFVMDGTLLTNTILDITGDGASIEINSLKTNGKTFKVTDDGLFIKDKLNVTGNNDDSTNKAANQIEITADSGYSAKGVTVAESVVKDSSSGKDVHYNNIVLSGALTYSTENTSTTGSVVTMTATGKRIVVSDSLDIGANTKFKVEYNSNLKVSGTITSTVAGSMIENVNGSTVAVTGLIQTLDDLNKPGVKAALHQSKVNNVTNYYYTALAKAIEAGATTIDLLGETEITDDLVIPSGVTVSYNDKVTVGSATVNTNTVTISSGAKIVQKNNATVDVLSTLVIEDKATGTVRNAAINSSVKTETDTSATYTNLVKALATTTEGTIELRDDADIAVDAVLASGVTLDTKAKRLSVTGSTLTVDGTLFLNATDLELKTNTTTSKEAKIVLNGTLKTDRPTSGYATKIAGAYYSITDDTAGTYNYIQPVASAAPGITTYDSQTITLRGDLDVGDVAFTGASDKEATVVIANAIEAGTVTLDYATLVFDTNATAAIGFIGNVSDKVGSVELNGTAAPGFKVVSATDSDGVTTFTVSGTFTVDTTVSKNKVKVDGDVVLDKLAATPVTVAGNAKVTGASDIDSLTVEGAVTVDNGATLSADKVEVLGTLSVLAATADGTKTAGTLSVEELYIGMASKDVAAAASVDGDVAVGDIMYVAAGSTFPTEMVEGKKSTEFYVEGKLWMTVYDFGAGTVTVTKSPVEDTTLNGWATEEGKASTNKVVTIDDNKVYADIEYDVYTVVFTTAEGINDVYVDGVLVKESTTVAAGNHTVSYTLDNGYTGQAKMLVDGKEVSGLTFTAEGDVGTTFNITLQGIEKAPAELGGGDAPTVIQPEKDEGMSLTDILLIILVVLIVIMAVIVALRLMRS